MMKNPESLKGLIKNKSKELRSSTNVILHNYMLERFLEKISISEYKYQFILKGRNVN